MDNTPKQIETRSAPLTSASTLLAALKELSEAVDAFGLVPREQAGKTDLWGHAYERREDARVNARVLIANFEGREIRE